jgi:hypothetical protein
MSLKEKGSRSCLATKQLRRLNYFAYPQSTFGSIFLVHQKSAQIPSGSSAFPAGQVKRQLTPEVA